MKQLIITNTVKRIALWYAAVMVGLYLLFNAFTLFELNYILVDELDTHLKHELEHILNTIEVSGDSIKILHPRELEEPDLFYVSDNPYFLQVYDLEGNLFFRSNNITLYGDLDLGFPNNFNPYYFEESNPGKDQLRTIYKELINKNNNKIGYIQLSAIQSSFNQVLKSVFLLNILTLPIILIIIVLLSIFLAKKSYAPINKIILLADSISATNLSERLNYDADPNDELGKLKKTLNSLFNRLENQISEISQFTDNASHQLMTPLTAIKAELDYILKRDYPTEEYKETCNILKTQTDRMILMVRSMLIMSKECGDCNNKVNVFNLSNLISSEISNIYPSNNVNITVEKNIYIRGNPEYFSIVVQNIINNALKYSEENKFVTVTLENKNEQAILEIADNGIGIKDDEKSKIFQRFYRVDSDEVKKISGYGLGLSLVQSVTESMGGSIIVLDNHPQGSIFRITIPILKFS